ncbi:MAG TPA: LpqB family beta-propeller domain-containing protein [Gemmatimonadales bacterium]|jgi:serine/threonine-protein kinase|nr:LpqB family beta-propeller domain-containing protein [Gemmatimonadales bacterium]
MAADFDRLKEALASRYELIRELGSGGMATVYLAQDLRHHRKVAVKVLRPVLAASLGSDRFFREIHVAAQLQHPHILPLLDSGEALVERSERSEGPHSFLYYVMPFVDGESLRERLQRGELPVEDALRILTEVADALAYAHGQGVVHRDIKPDNILLSGRHALVMDFGVAKAVSEAGQGQNLTETGMSVGTPAYMAPEQALADPNLDHRVDIYALGITGYEMLAGPPFQGTTPQEILAAQITQAPPALSTRRAAVPAALESIIIRCLEKLPADRWQSASDLFQRLLAIPALVSGSTPVTSVRPRAWRWVFLLGVAAGIGILTLVASRLSRPRAPDLELGRRTPITLSAGLEIYPSISPDGDLVAYTGGPDSRLYVRQVEGGNVIEVAHGLSGTQIYPFWSPDGKQLTFTSVRGIETVPSLGGAPRLLAPVKPGQLLFGGSWSPDGKEIGFVTDDTLFAVSAEGGKLRAITTAPQLHSCAWAADGVRIACVMGNSPSVTPGSLGNVAQSSIVIVPASGGAPKRVTEDSSGNLSPVWRPDGTLLFLSNRDGGRDVYAVRLKSDGSAASPPRRLTTGLNAISMSLTANGSRLVYAGFSEKSNIWTLPIPSRGVTTWSAAMAVTTGNQVIDMFDISPDGHSIAFASDRGGRYQVYRMPLDGSAEPDLVTHGILEAYWPRWSPDGKEISFHSFRNGHRQLYVVPSTGGTPSPVAVTDQDDRNRTWTPDGRAVIVGTDLYTPGEQCRIIRRAAAGAWEPPALWIKAACIFVVFSPDGGLAAELAPDGVWLVTPTGAPVRKLAEGRSLTGILRNPAWSGDGKTLYFVDSDSVGITIQGIPVAGGPPHLVMRFDDPTRPWHRYGFATFQDRFYFTVGELESDVWMAELK